MHRYLDLYETNKIHHVLGETSGRQCDTDSVIFTLPKLCVCKWLDGWFV